MFSATTNRTARGRRRCPPREGGNGTVFRQVRISKLSCSMERNEDGAAATAAMNNSTNERIHTKNNNDDDALVPALSGEITIWVPLIPREQQDDETHPGGGCKLRECGTFRDDSGRRNTRRNSESALPEHEQQQQLEDDESAAAGQWKDGLCSCFRLGILHPHLWSAFLCPHILLGQILVRTNLTWMAHHWKEPDTIDRNNKNNNDDDDDDDDDISNHDEIEERATGSNNNKSNIDHSNHNTTKIKKWTLRTVMLFLAVGSIYSVLYSPSLFSVWIDQQIRDKLAMWWSMDDDSNHNDDDSNYNNTPSVIDIPWNQLLCMEVLTLPMGIWGLCLVVRLRRSLRERYRIPPSTVTVPCCCGTNAITLSLGNRWEDLVCVLCCDSCVMGQMARHTADYEDTEVAAFWTANGLQQQSQSKPENEHESEHEMETTTVHHSGGFGTWCIRRYWRHRWFRRRSFSPNKASSSSSSSSNSSCSWTPNSTRSRSLSISSSSLSSSMSDSNSSGGSNSHRPNELLYGCDDTTEGVIGNGGSLPYCSRRNGLVGRPCR